MYVSVGDDFFGVIISSFVHAGVDCRSGSEFPISSAGLSSFVRECCRAVVEYLPQPRERALRLVKEGVGMAPMAIFFPDRYFYLLIEDVNNNFFSSSSYFTVGSNHKRNALRIVINALYDSNFLCSLIFYLGRQSTDDGLVLSDLHLSIIICTVQISKTLAKTYTHNFQPNVLSFKILHGYLLFSC